jgi:sporulation protein YlmC with PRC-barrel domain
MEEQIMALIKLKEIQHTRQGSNADDKFDIDSFSVYTTPDEKVGSVKDVLVDENEGIFRYLIVDTGPWVFGKTVLLPIGLARFDYDEERVYVDGWTKEQVQNLPEFKNDLKIDEAYEEQVRGIYRPMASNRGTQSSTTGSMSSGDVMDRSSTQSTTADSMSSGNAMDRGTYSYDQDPYLYNRNVDDSDRLRLYERGFHRSRSPQ